MATFHIPSHMVRSGMAMPAGALKSWAGHATYGDGLRAQLILQCSDRLFEVLTFAGYQPVAVYVQPGADLPGETLAFENLDHLGYSIEHYDWVHKTGLPTPTNQDSLVIAVVVDERRRYNGAGPSFAVALPSLGQLGPFEDSIGGVVYHNVYTSTLTRPKAPTATVPHPPLRTIQVEARAVGAPLLGLQTAAVAKAAVAIAGVVFQDLFTAGHALEPWYLAAPDVPQPGLLPAFIAPRWKLSKPWLVEPGSTQINAFGAELYAAISGGSLALGDLLGDQVLTRSTVGELLAKIRGLPVPPHAATELAAALLDRLRAINGQHYPATGGPLEGIEQQSCFRVLVMAHELGIVDVLGESPATTSDSDVAPVRAARISIDVTGRYESRWDWRHIDTYQPSWVGCLQINEVGHAISGWWQTRGWRDQAAKQITTIQHAFVAELHDTSDEFVPVLRYSLDGGATWHGLMTFDLDDTDGSAIGGLQVQYGTVTAGSNVVGRVDIPDGICTMWSYDRIDTQPYLHDRSLESLPPAVATAVVALARTPLHLSESERLDAAITVLINHIQAWENNSPGPAKTGAAAQADFDIAAAYIPYLHPSDADGLIVPARKMLIDRLIVATVDVNGTAYSAYLKAVMMASAYAAQTPHLRQLLGITGAEGNPNLPTFTYDWYITAGGISGDAGEGTGGFLGTMTITKKQNGKTLWSSRFGADVVEFSQGISVGVLFTKATGGTIESIADWQPEDFNGEFSVWGADSGVIVVQYGWTGGISFFGSGNNVPLSGPANGLNWAVGAYAILIEIGGGAGSLKFGANPQDVEITTTLTSDYAIRHAVAKDWAGEEAFFDVDSSVVRDTMVPRLESMLADHLAGFMDANGRITIDGNSSATGPDQVNDPLSVRRAQAVCESIRILLGERLLIPEERIDIVGHGEQNAPGGPDGPEVDSARRVDVFMDANLMVGYR